MGISLLGFLGWLEFSLLVEGAESADLFLEGPGVGSSFFLVLDVLVGDEDWDCGSSSDSELESLEEEESDMSCLL